MTREKGTKEKKKKFDPASKQRAVRLFFFLIGGNFFSLLGKKKWTRLEL